MQCYEMTVLNNITIKRHVRFFVQMIGDSERC